MRKLYCVLFLVILSIGLIGVVSAQTQVSYFYGNGCPHCANVDASGILEKVSENVTLNKYEIYNNVSNRDLFTKITEDYNISTNQRGVPFALINCSGNLSYLVGDGPIINNLESLIQQCVNTLSLTKEKGNHKITLGVVILAGLADSLNPCALGVLAFLMISLTRIGSAKRALKGGILYSFVVFVVYLLSGFGLFKAVQSFSSVTHYVYIGAGVLVLFFGLTQIIDVFAPGKFISLRIPLKAKPMIEKIATNGTIPAIIILGIIVAIFELPCTVWVYLGILTMMSVDKTFAIWYLIVYNLMFILPLLIMTFIIYKGTKAEKMQNWTIEGRSWMKIVSAIVMVALGIYILISVF
jgi:cytochrome c biogenesis protein CcdA